MSQRIGVQAAVGLLCICFAAQAQAPRAGRAFAEPESPRVSAPLDVGTSVLRLLKFNGVIRDRLGQPRTGVVGLTFALYKDREGGAPLWMETQNAELDEQGRYGVLLGSTQSEGLPLELFTTGEPRWLGVQAQLPGEEEQPRVLLVSVPYALKAADAETLGGKPLSAFVLAEGPGAGTGQTPASTDRRTSTEAPAPARRGPVASVTSANYIAKFAADGVTPENSILYQLNSNIGLATTNPQAPLHIASIQAHRNLNLGSLQTGAYPGIMLENTATSGSVAFTENNGLQVLTKNSTSADFVASDLKLVLTQGGNLGLGTGSPQAPLHIGTIQAHRSLNLGSLQTGAYPGIMLENTATNGSVAFTENNGLQVFVKASTSADFAAADLKLFVDQGGNVGIGTSTPAQKLEVAGTVKLTGTIGVDGIIFPDGTKQKTACDTFAFGNVKPSGSAAGIVGLFPSAGEPVPSLHLDNAFRPGAGETTSCSVGAIAGLLLEAIQKQEAQILELRAEIEALKARAARAGCAT